MKIQFIKATINDVKTIASLAVLMWTSYTIEALTKEFLSVVNSDNSAVYLLSIENNIVGFAQCGLRHDYVEGTSSSPVGYLEGIFVEEKYRKQGYAKQLLNCCEQWAKDKGCTEFASDCELDNEISQQFHMNLGFKEANRIICFKKKL